MLERTREAEPVKVTPARHAQGDGSLSIESTERSAGSPHAVHLLSPAYRASCVQCAESLKAVATELQRALSDSLEKPGFSMY